MNRPVGISLVIVRESKKRAAASCNLALVGVEMFLSHGFQSFQINISTTKDWLFFNAFEAVRGGNEDIW